MSILVGTRHGWGVLGMVLALIKVRMVNAVELVNAFESQAAVASRYKRIGRGRDGSHLPRPKNLERNYTLKGLGFYTCVDTYAAKVGSIVHPIIYRLMIGKVYNEQAGPFLIAWIPFSWHRSRIDMATTWLSTLSLKITLPVMLIAAAAIVLTAFLNHGKFERTLTELEVARIEFVVNDLKTNLETGLGFGLALTSLANAQTAIDAEMRKDAAVLAITIYDDTGTVVFHAGPGRSSTIPAAWQAAARENSKTAHHWRRADADGLVVGTNLTSAIGTPAGGIALRYSRHRHHEVVDSVARSLQLACAAITVLTVLAALLGVYWLVAQTDRTLQRIENLLDPVRLGSPVPLRTQPDSDAMQLASDVLRTSRGALRDLNAAQPASPDAALVHSEPNR